VQLTGGARRPREGIVLQDAPDRTSDATRDAPGAATGCGGPVNSERAGSHAGCWSVMAADAPPSAAESRRTACRTCNDIRHAMHRCDTAEDSMMCNVLARRRLPPRGPLLAASCGEPLGEHLRGRPRLTFRRLRARWLRAASRAGASVGASVGGAARRGGGGRRCAQRRGALLVAGEVPLDWRAVAAAVGETARRGAWPRGGRC
jgi:hypothetical protein